MRGKSGSGNDVVEANSLLHGQGTDVFADACYQKGRTTSLTQNRPCQTSQPRQYSFNMHEEY
jgi:hypothetical protein